MPQRLALPDGREHIVGQPVEDPAPEQAVADAQAALEEGTAEPAITPCVTAFTVYLMDDGDALLGIDVWADPQPARKPTFDEIYHAATVVTWHVRNYSWRMPGMATDGCVTAFTPYLTEDGRWLISADAADPLVPGREPTEDEIVGGLSVVLRDVHTQEILTPLFSTFSQQLVQQVTQNVIGNMIQLGQQAQQVQQGLDVAHKLEQDRLRRGGR